jgi:hypothetical protein
MQGICSLSHTPPLLSRAALVDLVGGAIPPSLAFHPTAKASTPIAGEFPSVQLKKTHNLFIPWGDLNELIAKIFNIAKTYEVN